MNTGSGEISSYQIAPNGALTLIGSTVVSNTAGVGATDPSVSPDGRTLYVNESRVGTVGAFAINNGGTLTELPSSPVSLPAGVHPAGIVTTGFGGCSSRKLFPIVPRAGSDVLPALARFGGSMTSEAAASMSWGRCRTAVRLLRPVREVSVREEIPADEGGIARSAESPVRLLPVAPNAEARSLPLQRHTLLA